MNEPDDWRDRPDLQAEEFTGWKWCPLFDHLEEEDDATD